MKTPPCLRGYGERTAPKKKNKGFTLVELLAAVMILSILVVLMVQLTNSASGTISASNRGLDTASQCRLTFDRMAFDLAAMVKRPDVDYTFAKVQGDDALSFYCQSKGLFPPGTAQAAVPRAVSVVGYRVTASPSRPPRLERGARGIDWSQMVFTPLVSASQQSIFQEPNSLPPIDEATTSPSNYLVLADQVIRFEYCFLTKGDPSSHTPPQLQTTFQGSLDHLAAIVVGIAVIDKKSSMVIQDYSKLTSALPDAVDGQDIASLWLPVINNTDFATKAGIPLPAAQAVSVYQRYFFLK